MLCPEIVRKQDDGWKNAVGPFINDLVEFSDQSLDLISQLKFNDRARENVRDFEARLFLDGTADGEAAVGHGLGLKF